MSSISSSNPSSTTILFLYEKHLMSINKRKNKRRLFFLEIVFYARSHTWDQHAFFFFLVQWGTFINGMRVRERFFYFLTIHNIVDAVVSVYKWYREKKMYVTYTGYRVSGKIRKRSK